MFKEKEVLKLKDGSVAFVSDESDFKYLIVKYMGYDAAELFNKIINNNEEDNTNSDLSSYEASLESNTTCFLDILEEMKSLRELMQKPRLDRSKISEVIEDIEKAINNQI